MKRLRHILPFCILLVCTSVQTGCKGEDEPQNVQSISFSPQTEKVDSRADFIENSSDLGHFIVWGNYDRKAVFTAQKVNRVDGYWEYTPLQHWILSADSYDFSAYSPENAGTPNIVDNQLASVSYDCNEQQIDLMMAYTAVPKEKIGETVLMTFNHALAAVNFSFKLDNLSYTQNYNISVTNFEVGNIHFAGDLYLNHGVITAQTTDEEPGELNVQFPTNNIPLDTSGINSEFQFVFPQESEANFNVTYEVNGVERNISKNIPIEWKPGYKYTYTITISPIEITVTTTEWQITEINQSIPNS